MDNNYRVIYTLDSYNNIKLENKYFNKCEQAVAYYESIVKKYMSKYGYRLNIALYEGEAKQMLSLSIRNDC